MSKLTIFAIAYLLTGALLAAWTYWTVGRHDLRHRVHPLITCAFLTLCYPLVFWRAWKDNRP